MFPRFLCLGFLTNACRMLSPMGQACGVGFDVPVSLASIEPIEPKPEAVVEQEVAVTA
jgi:hypothetical protein